VTALVLSVVRTPVGIVAPGTQLTFQVTASDADARSVTFSFAGTDSGGNRTTIQETVTVSDPVTVDTTSSDPAIAITRDALDTNVWHATV